jgi:hypothetical protein
MKLQAEAKQSRRQSIQTPIALSPGGSSLTAPPLSNKRASFTPLTGSHMRPPPRGSSVSVSDSAVPGLYPGAIDGLPGTSPPDRPDNNGLVPNGSSNPPRRFSGLFGRTSPQPVINREHSPPVPDIEELKREMKGVRDELEETRRELAESNEAREASETCVKALREFIGENQIGGGGVSGQMGTMKLPPPPHMANGDETDESADSNKKAGTTGGWSFKLWSGVPGSSKKAAPDSSTSSYPQEQSFRRGSNASLSRPPPQVRSNTSSQPPTFGRFGGFFGSRANSISSVASVSSTTLANPLALQGSDTSSEAEPISPAGEMVGGSLSPGHLRAMTESNAIEGS